MSDSAVVRTLLTGLGLGESPRWHEGRLWFCDWVAGEVLTLDASGASHVALQIQSFPFSIDWLPDGPLLVISGSDRRLLRQESVRA